MNAKTFLGGISNSGKIVGTNGIGLSSVAIFGGSGSGGAIVNSGSISATHDGLRLILGFGTFAGGVTNAGVISAGATGVDISQIGMLSGGIVNSGTIAGKLGIGVFTTTVAGGIVDSGSIKATEAGISIDGLSEVLASKTAIDIAGPTFTGGIFNAGVVSGSAGIEIKSARAVSIFDGGTIIGTGGTAIEFAGSGNTLTLGAGSRISMPPTDTFDSAHRAEVSASPPSTCRRHLDGQQREHRPLDHQGRHAGDYERRLADQHNGQQRRRAGDRLRRHRERRDH